MKNDNRKAISSVIRELNRLRNCRHISELNLSGGGVVKELETNTILFAFKPNSLIQNFSRYLIENNATR